VSFPSPSYIDLLALCVPAAVFVIAVMIGRLLERAWPIEADQPVEEIAIDYRLAVLNLLVAGGLSLLPISLAAGETRLVRFDATGWHFVPALVLYLLMLDLMLYWFHRAQHAVPFLWAMHSLHHSCEALTVATGARHFWLEGTVKRLFLLPLTAWICAVPAAVGTSAALLYLIVDSCAHLNVRAGLGRCALLVNNPQFHRLHHSAQPEHANKNFADLLPVWDVLFGTVWRLSPDEWPATGLTSLDRPRGVIDGLIWPVRSRTRRPAARA
jgi:sterol desaturase/sphingolipid hydroxylase (fatty acid hydroxylase superfamily)